MSNRFGVLSGGLACYLEAVEDFFPYAATQQLMRQHSKHARDADRFPEDEIEYLQKEFDDHLSETLPRAILGSALVVLYSAFESTVSDFARDLEKELSLPSVDTSFRDGTRDSLPIKAERYFRSTYDIRLFSNDLERVRINEILREFRNSFVHHQNAFHKLPHLLKNSIVESKKKLTHCEIKGDIWVPSIICVKAHGLLVRNWAWELSGRIVERFPAL